MAQGKSDGTVYIDTKIDTSGIDDGMKNLGSDIKKNTKGVEDAGKELGEEFSEGFEKGISAPTQGIEQKLKSVSNSMTSFGNKMSLVVTAPLSMLGGKMVESAAEMNAAASQFSQVFGELEGNGESCKIWRQLLRKR